MEPEILAAALEYAAAGWHVFPCRGKRPITKNGLLDASKDPAQVRAWWAEHPKATLAVSCGPSGLVVLDVDVRPDRDGRESLEDFPALPDTLSSTTRSGGQHHFFRGAATSKNGFLPGLDRKAQGGYVIIPPSPGYHWDGAEFDPSTILPAPKWLTATPEKRAEPLPSAACLLDPEQVHELRSALSYISACSHDTWIQIGMALHSTGAGQQAFGLWDEWSKTAPNYDPKLARRWSSFSEYGGVTKATIFQLAKNNGWVEPYAEAIEAVEPTPPLPEPVTDWRPPRGVLRDLYEYILSTARRRQETSALCAALAYGSIVLGRRYQGSTGLRTNLYTINIIGAGGGKDHGRKVLKDIFKTIGLGHAIGEEVFSGPGVYSGLVKFPKRLYLFDEFGRMMQRAAAEGPSGNTHTLLTALMRAFSSSDSTLYLPEYATLGQRNKQQQAITDIEYPCLSVLASTTPDNFYEALTSGDATGGLLARFLIFQGADKLPKKQRPQLEPVPERITEWGIRMQNPETIGNLTARSPSTPLTVFPDPDAEQLLIDFEIECDERLEEADRESVKALWGRGYELADKLSTIVAASSGFGLPACKVEHARWATGMVRARIIWLAKQLTENISNTWYEKARGDAERALKDAGRAGLTEIEMGRHETFRQWEPRQRAALLRDLKEAELADRLRIPPQGGRGRPRNAWVSSIYFGSSLRS